MKRIVLFVIGGITIGLPPYLIFNTFSVEEISLLIKTNLICFFELLVNNTAYLLKYAPLVGLMIGLIVGVFFNILYKSLKN